MFDDVRISYDSIVLISKEKGDDGQAIKKKIDLKWDSRMGISVAEDEKLLDCEI